MTKPQAFGGRLGAESPAMGIFSIKIVSYFPNYTRKVFGGIEF